MLGVGGFSETRKNGRNGGQCLPSAVVTHDCGESVRWWFARDSSGEDSGW